MSKPAGLTPEETTPLVVRIEVASQRRGLFLRSLIRGVAAGNRRPRRDVLAANNMGYCGVEAIMHIESTGDAASETDMKQDVVTRDIAWNCSIQFIHA